MEKRIRDDSGIRKLCPECRKFAFKGLKFVGESEEEMMLCPHCGAPLFRTIRIEKRVVVTLVKMTAIFLVMAGLTFYSHQTTAKKTLNCTMFKTQHEAQKTYDSGWNKDGTENKYQLLDKNYNNIPCEDLP